MSPMLASPRPFGAEIQVLHVRLRGDLVASGLGGEAQLGLRPARAVPTSSQDWSAREGREPPGYRPGRRAGRWPQN
jgi:hypothetical protein